ncbi:Isoflavone reductase [Photobacterium marinum]|uniref:Isoflavone reductase n=1 Tax=Photobacterium marinum TaxID=1056511 RepID=L8JDJ7_9GAMM|nr:aromatic alcohol reductase [Photobacterium marinum]ELR66921.1 Isoflavone reductase [Photobacterium marinum]
MYTFRKQTVAVIGATGQVGTPLTKNLLLLGHDVLVLTRSLNSEKISEFQALGARMVEVKDMMDVDLMATTLAGVETLICAVPGSKYIVTQAEPLWLDAAVKAGVKRFVPTEFGAHTRGLELGDGVIFDHKKALHQKIFESGLSWTFFYTGGIFDYFLPNLRFFRKITTFGDLDIPIYTHHINDIGAVAAMALTDDRTVNRCVQLDFNVLSQNEMLEQIEANFPDYDFEYEHFSSEFITEARNTAGDEVTAKKGAETDRERWGINYVIYVIGKLASFTDETLGTAELYPEYQVSMTPEQALADPDFVFEK